MLIVQKRGFVPLRSAFFWVKTCWTTGTRAVSHVNSCFSTSFVKPVDRQQILSKACRKNPPKVSFLSGFLESRAGSKME